VFEDIKGVIRIRKSKKDRQHNVQKKKKEKQSTKHTHKAKDRVTRIAMETNARIIIHVPASHTLD